MPIKAGIVAYIKTTEEPVFVMSTTEAGDVASIRRPVQGQNGIDHKIEDNWLSIELETQEENAMRRANSQKMIQKLFAASAEEEFSAATPTKVTPN